MQPVLIVIHLLIVIALVGIVLIQRSEGGGLGIGGGSGFMTARGTRNALTRLTAILAGCFFLTSIVLTVLQATSNPTSSPDLLDRINELGSEFGGALGGSANGSVDEGSINILPDAQSAPTSVPDLGIVPDELAPSAQTPPQTETVGSGERAPIPD